MGISYLWTRTLVDRTDGPTKNHLRTTETRRRKKTRSNFRVFRKLRVQEENLSYGSQAKWTSAASIGLPSSRAIPTAQVSQSIPPNSSVPGKYIE